MKFRTMIWLAGAATVLMVAGTAVAQQKDAAKADAATEQSHKDGSNDQAKAQADARKRADAEAAKQRRAERKASKTGDDREEEEEKPVR